MKLYGSLASPYVARAVLTARWKGLDVPLSPPPGGSIKSPEYLRINPLGKMPALEDRGGSLFESTVICEYLDETQPGRKLVPTDPLERARARLIARYVDLYLVPHLSVFFRNANPATRNQAEVDGALTALRKSLADLEAFMGPGPWALGGEASLADAVMAPTFFVAFAMLPMFGVSDLLAGQPKLECWWQQVDTDPVAKVLHQEYRDAFNAFLKSRLAAA
jgi:glutathione S-transferase